MPNENILVLEDHTELREEIRQILTHAGYRVQVASNGTDALAAVRREPFDLLVADVVLPDLSGIEAFQQMRAIQPDLAGIVMTAYSTWEMAMEALHAGFVGFIVKPFVPEQLAAAVVNALEQEKLRRENARLRALVPLYELSRAFMGTIEVKDLLEQIVTIAREETKAEVVSIMLLDDNRRELRIAAAAGLPNEVIETQKIGLGSGIAGRVAQRGEALIIDEGLPLDAEVRQGMARPEIVSALSLPLRSRGQVIGVLNLSRLRGDEPFNPGDLELATVLASQAAIAIDQARLVDQLKRLSDISQRLASAVDVEESSALIAAAPIQLVNARGAALWLIEGALQPTLVKSCGLENLSPPIFTREKITEEFTTDGDGSWFTVPLQRGDKLLGALTVRLPSPEPPGEERSGLLRTLAHAAGAAIESHRLRAREARAFHEVDRAVRADLNVQELLQRLLNQMISVCEADGGAIYSYDAERDRVEPWVQTGLAVPETFVRALLYQDETGFPAGPRELREVPFPSDAKPPVIGVPLLIGSRSGGVAALTRSPGSRGFTPQHIALLSSLTSMAALAVRNAQLYARSEEATIAEERTRIAREMHDGILQDLSFLLLKVSTAQKFLKQGEDKNLQKELREISDQLRRDADEVRRAVFALRPLDIESLGFLPALEKFVHEFGQANDIASRLDARGDASHLSPKMETALFRLTQEALNNVRKHARAKHVWVDLEFAQGRVVILQVRDDGRGFEVERVLKNAQARGSVGLKQMRERVERAGGTFTIETAPRQGTRLQMELPMREM